MHRKPTWNCQHVHPCSFISFDFKAVRVVRLMNGARHGEEKLRRAKIGIVSHGYLKQLTGRIVNKICGKSPKGRERGKH